MRQIGHRNCQTDKVLDVPVRFLLRYYRFLKVLLTV